MIAHGGRGAVSCVTRLCMLVEQAGGRSRRDAIGRAGAPTPPRGDAQCSVSRGRGNPNGSRRRRRSARPKVSAIAPIGSASADDERPGRGGATRRRHERLCIGARETRARGLAQRALCRVDARASVARPALDVRGDDPSRRRLPLERPIHPRRDPGQGDLHGGEHEDQPARCDGTTSHERLRSQVASNEASNAVPCAA